MALENYYECAEDDYLYFRDALSAGLFANSNGAFAQSICERYMKHLISNYYTPKEGESTAWLKRVMETHNLKKIKQVFRE